MKSITLIAFLRGIYKSSYMASCFSIIIILSCLRASTRIAKGNSVQKTIISLIAFAAIGCAQDMPINFQNPEEEQVVFMGFPDDLVCRTLHGRERSTVLISNAPSVGGHSGVLPSLAITIGRYIEANSNAFPRRLGPLFFREQSLGDHMDFFGYIGEEDAGGVRDAGHVAFSSEEMFIDRLMNGSKRERWLSLSVFLEAENRIQAQLFVRRAMANSWVRVKWGDGIESTQLLLPYTHSPKSSPSDPPHLGSRLGLTYADRIGPSIGTDSHGDPLFVGYQGPLVRVTGVVDDGSDGFNDFLKKSGIEDKAEAVILLPPEQRGKRLDLPEVECLEIIYPIELKRTLFVPGSRVEVLLTDDARLLDVYSIGPKAP